VAWRLVRHFCSRKFPEFVINQGQQFLRGFGVPLLDAVEDVGDVAHGAKFKVRGVEAESSILDNTITLRDANLPELWGPYCLTSDMVYNAS
jgi:hypothetical protein